MRLSRPPHHNIVCERLSQKPHTHSDFPTLREEREPRGFKPKVVNQLQKSLRQPKSPIHSKLRVSDETPSCWEIRPPQVLTPREERQLSIRDPSSLSPSRVWEISNPKSRFINQLQKSLRQPKSPIHSKLRVSDETPSCWEIRPPQVLTPREERQLSIRDPSSLLPSRVLHNMFYRFFCGRLKNPTFFKVLLRTTSSSFAIARVIRTPHVWSWASPSRKISTTLLKTSELLLPRALAPFDNCVLPPPLFYYYYSSFLNPPLLIFFLLFNLNHPQFLIAFPKKIIKFN